MPEERAKKKRPIKTRHSASNGNKKRGSSNISYVAPPTIPDASRRKLSRKRGRKRTHWSKSSAYNRRANPKRLRRCDVENAKAADAFASTTGRRLETFVTVRWAETAEGEDCIRQRFSAFLTKLRNWLARRGICLCFIYVHENPPRAKPGFHTHLLLNVPALLRTELEVKLVEWFSGSRSAVDVRPRSVPGYVADDRLSYMLKGTDKATAMKYRLMNQHGWDFNQGVVQFKRWGVSNNINAAARAKWRSTND